MSLAIGVFMLHNDLFCFFINLFIFYCFIYSLFTLYLFL